MRVLAATLCLALAACGYRAIAPPSDIGGEIQIQMLSNRTKEPGVERLLVDAIHEEFLRRGALRPRFSGPAGLILSGSIRELAVRHTAFSSVALALEDQVDVVLDVSIERVSDGATVWRRDGWAHAERFTTSSDPHTYESNKEQALRRLSSAVAGRIHDELFQSF